MCEFCHKHREGKKWCLKAENYSDDLLSDLKRRKFIVDFFSHPEKLARVQAELGKLPEMPGFVRSVLVQPVTSQHFPVLLGHVPSGFLLCYT